MATKIEKEAAPKNKEYRVISPIVRNGKRYEPAKGEPPTVIDLPAVQATRLIAQGVVAELSGEPAATREKPANEAPTS